ncbi:MAG: hypothetical protein AAF439_11500 [Pseudomonadota bacterium]
MKIMWIAGATLGAVLTASAWAASGNVKIEPPAEGTVSVEQGLDAWARIYEVASHPRCANCHTGASDRPMWSGPSYGKTRPHGMNVRAGKSRIGAETIPCATCHIETTRASQAPHHAPRVGMAWSLAPVYADWFGRTSKEICEQLRDPAKNGGRDHMGLARHVDHDLILHWAWNPGGGREPAPYSLQEHADDILAWGVAGMPCPTE